MQMRSAIAAMAGGLFLSHSCLLYCLYTLDAPFCLSHSDEWARSMRTTASSPPAIALALQRLFFPLPCVFQHQRLHSPASDNVTLSCPNTCAVSTRVRLTAIADRLAVVARGLEVHQPNLN